MWRILTIIAGTVLLAISAVLGFLNKNKLAEEVTNLEQIRESVKERQKRIDSDKALLDKAEKDRDEAQAITKTMTTELADLKAKNETIRMELAAAKDLVAENKEKIDKLKKSQEGAPDLDAIAEKINELKKEQAKFSQEVADKEAQLAATESKLGVVTAKIKASQQREEDIRKRISPSELKTNIASVHQALGFVIINAGGNKNVVLGSNLAVMRGTEKIGELVVSSVEKNRSSADVVPGSLAAGQMLMPGDVVVAIRPAPVAPAKKDAAPKADSDATPSDAAPADDAASDDIFGDAAADAAAETPAEPKADDSAEPKADGDAEETPADAGTPAETPAAPAEGTDSL